MHFWRGEEVAVFSAFRPSRLVGEAIQGQPFAIERYGYKFPSMDI